MAPITETVRAELNELATSVADDQAAEEFNAVPDVELPDELRELADEFPFDGPPPPSRHPMWAKWMGHRRRLTGRLGGRPPKAKAVDEMTATIVAAAEEIAALELADKLVVAATLAQPHRAKAIAVLVVQMDSKDESIAQRAAIKLLEITDGKPAQTIIEKQDGITVIEYRTSALIPEFVPGAGLESPGDAAALAHDDD